jgi:hypothetical protein
MCSHLNVRNSAIEVVVHLPHELENLLLCDEEAHALESLMELVNLNELVLVQVNLIKHFFERQSLLLKNLEQMIKNVILGDHPFLLTLQILHPFVIILPIKPVPLFILYNPVPI